MERIRPGPARSATWARGQRAAPLMAFGALLPRLIRLPTDPHGSADLEGQGWKGGTAWPPLTSPSEIHRNDTHGISVLNLKGTRMDVRKAGSLFVLAASVVLFVASPASSQQVPTNVVYVSEEGGRISVIDLNSLQVVKVAEPNDLQPRGIGLVRGGRYLVTANKGTSDVTVFDARDLRLVQRIRVGGNPEFVKIHPNGKLLFVSCETVSAPLSASHTAGGEQDAAGSQIVTLSTRNWSRGRTFTAGSETEGIEFSPDGRALIVANEAQDSLSVFRIATGQRAREIDLSPYGSRPRGVKLSPQGNTYAVTMEASATLLLLDQNFNVTRFVTTGAMPDGVSFDRQGRRIVVAAARAQKIQFFAADSLQLLGEAPVGQRCWHFTFTQDDSKILVACGRSNSIDVIDAATYRPIRTLTGFQTPWGIVTYPRSYGSLDLP